MSDDFARAVEIFRRRVETNTRAAYVRTAELVHESVVHGSPVTSAPGQPIATGNLRASWNLTVGPTEALIATNVEYAPIIEHNVRGATFRNHGAHSVALTVQGFDRLVAQAVREVDK